MPLRRRAPGATLEAMTVEGDTFEPVPRPPRGAKRRPADRIESNQPPLQPLLVLPAWSFPAVLETRFRIDPDANGEAAGQDLVYLNMGHKPARLTPPCGLFVDKPEDVQSAGQRRT